ncbi:MAG TPA: HAD-IIIC family phosphatase, partial [Candidatus Angelobacter sp.]|nr:HAD-IIIC family phosphatase [Candidatus Angelobacter sp.]
MSVGTAAVPAREAGELSPPLTVYIAASFVSEPVRKSLECWLTELNVQAVLTFSYAQLFQELLDANSPLTRNARGLNVVLFRLSDVMSYQDGDAAELAAALSSAVDMTKVSNLVCICPDSEPVAQAAHWKESLLQRLAGRDRLEIVDASETLFRGEATEIYDPYRERLGHIPYTESFFAELGTIISRRICLAENLFGIKVIVLDCDNTLWKGICGEEGPSGIELTEGHSKLQEFMLEQQKAGRLLCLCSKNNQADVDAVFEAHPEMPLKPEHFVASRINWNRKPDNFRELAHQLNLSLEAFAFLDDDPLECSEMRQVLPEVLTIKLPESAFSIPDFLNRLWALDPPRRTDEAASRTQMYREHAEREAFRKGAYTLADFLAGLRLEVAVSDPDAESYLRIEELTMRTNQFNMTTIRRTVTELRNLLDSGELEGRVTRVCDRFGKYGLVGVSLFRSHNQALEIDTFLLSCRVLGRGVEHRMMSYLGKIATQRGLPEVCIQFSKTAKNQPAFNFLQGLTDATIRKEETVQGMYFVFDAARLLELRYEPSPEIHAPVPPATVASHKPQFNKSALTSRIVKISTSSSAVLEFIRKNRARSRFVDSPYVPPQTEMECKLQNLWEDVLEVRPVGIMDEFFRLGGDSLSATQVISRVKELFQVELTFVTLFTASTIAGLAQWIENWQLENPKNQFPAITQADRTGLFPLSFAQQRLWFLQQFESDQALYNIGYVVRLMGSLDRVSLRRSIQ